MGELRTKRMKDGLAWFLFEGTGKSKILLARGKAPLGDKEAFRTQVKLAINMARGNVGP